MVLSIAGLLFSSLASIGKAGICNSFTTRYNRWASEARDSLFKTAYFTQVSDNSLLRGQFPKIAAALHLSAFRKLFGCQTGQYILCRRPIHKTFHLYQEATQYWVKATGSASILCEDGKVGAPATDAISTFPTVTQLMYDSGAVLTAVFTDFFTHTGTHLVQRLIGHESPLALAHQQSWMTRVNNIKELMKDLKCVGEENDNKAKDGDKISYDEFHVSGIEPSSTKSYRALATHYGFTDEELTSSSTTTSVPDGRRQGS